jgi:hypothetical protein
MPKRFTHVVSWQYCSYSVIFWWTDGTICMILIATGNSGKLLLWTYFLLTSVSFRESNFFSQDTCSPYMTSLST